MIRNRCRPLLALLLAALLGLATAQQQGGTLTAAWAQDPVGLDPHLTSAYSSFQILENVLDTLVTLDAGQNVVPSLAESWESSEDGLQWTFHLRSGLSFSNGRALTADDVVYTFERMLDPETGSGNAYLLAGVTDVEAVDDSTVVLTLDAPNVALLGHLAVNKSVGIIARESVEDGTINTRPIGSGPFRIADFQPGTLVRLERNEHYWQDGLPYLDAIDIRIIPDESVRRTALVTGDVDWSISVPAQSVSDLDSSDEVVIDQTTAGAYWYLGVNTEREPLDDPRVRQALSYALQRDNIALAAAFGNAQATQDPIPSSSSWAFDYAPYDYDPERARELLAEAGVGDDFVLELMPTTQYEESIRVAQVVQANLADIGVQASIRTLEWAEWLEEEGAGNYDTYVCSWNALVDPDDYFYAQHKTGEVFNFTGYSNDTVDELLERGRGTEDLIERLPIYEQINRIIVDEAPYIYLYNPLNIHAYRPYVEGFEARPDQAVRFAETWLDR
ncbi:MAG: ABC transporter substrate-binding protein [Trueperaceae bacterium]